MHKQVIAIIGPSGSGKSVWAIKEFGKNGFLLNRPDPGDRSVWFDNYDGEEVIIVPEMDGWIGQVQLQTMLDYCTSAYKVKGAFTGVATKKFVLCSNLHPYDWFKEGLQAPMKRRLKAPQGKILYKHSLADDPREIDLELDYAWDRDHEVTGVNVQAPIFRQR